MVDSLGLNTSLVGANSFNTGVSNPLGFRALGNTSTGSSVFSTPFQSNNMYNNDVMMSGLDFSSLSYDEKTGTIVRRQPAQAPAQNNAQVPVQNTQIQNAQAPAMLAQQPNNGVQNFTSNQPLGASVQPTGNTVQNPNGEPNFDELNNYLTNREAAQAKAPSNVGKYAGAILGFLAPIGERLIAGLKGGSIAKAMNWKQLAVTCPIIALGGFGAGYLIDNIINSNKNKPVETQATVQSQQLAVQPQRQVVQQQQPQLQFAA